MGRIEEVPLFLLGYYGFGNWGDELSLLATLRALEDVRNELSLPLTYRVLAGDSRFLPPLPGKVEVVPRGDTARILLKLSGSRCVVVGGGSLLQDITSFRSLLYYATLLAFAQALGKETLFFGCGLGPFQRRVSEKIVSFLLRRSAMFLARDEETLCLLAGNNPRNTVLTADPVFLLWEGEEAYPSSRVAIFLRRKALERRDDLCEGFMRLQREGWDLEFVAFHKSEDWEVTTGFAERLGAPVRHFLNVSEVLSYFQSLGGVVSMRFHPLVLATCAGVPWFAFDLDPKIVAFSTHWNRENLIPLATWIPSKLSECFQRISTIRERTRILRGLFQQRALAGKTELCAFFARLPG